MKFVEWGLNWMFLTSFRFNFSYLNINIVLRFCYRLCQATQTRILWPSTNSSHRYGRVKFGSCLTVITDAPPVCGSSCMAALGTTELSPIQCRRATGGAVTSSLMQRTTATGTANSVRVSASWRTAEPARTTLGRRIMNGTQNGLAGKTTAGRAIPWRSSSSSIKFASFPPFTSTATITSRKMFRWVLETHQSRGLWFVTSMLGNATGEFKLSQLSELVPPRAR